MWRQGLETKDHMKAAQVQTGRLLISAARHHEEIVFAPASASIPTHTKTNLSRGSKSCCAPALDLPWPQSGIGLVAAFDKILFIIGGN